MRGLTATGALQLALVIATGGSAAGQDIVLRGEVDGAPVPRAYFDDVARNPDLFTLPRTWGQHASAEGRPVQGTLPVLVIPALFADSPDPWVSREQIDRILFTGPAPHGTLTEFYHELSGGLLNVTGAVSPWVRTHLTVQQVTAGQAGFGPNARVGEYLWRALQEADRHVDFGEFDNDGPDGIPNSGDDDGVVDAVAFEFMEVSASCGGNGIWPHRSAISWRTGGDAFASEDSGPNGPIYVDGYIIQSVSDCSGRGVQTANVIGHEMGHVLGLPDLYHPIDGTLPTQRRWVVGCWGLMAAGSWGCGDPSVRTEAFGPTRMTPWSLARLGWSSFQDVGPDAVYEEFVLEPTITGGRPLRVPLGGDERESLVLEYRVRQGFDEPLPGSGVLAYRWNLDGILRPERGSDLPYVFRLLEGDGRGNMTLTHPEGGNRGEVSDLLGFPGNTPMLSAASTPSTRRHDGTISTVTVHRVEVGGGVARVWISTAPEPHVLGPDALAPSVHSPLIAHRTIGGGAQPFSVVSVVGPEWLSVTAAGDRLDLTGIPSQEGAAQIAIEVVDALGGTVSWEATFVVEPFSVPTARLVAGVLEPSSSPLVPSELAALDEGGNGNGRLDIGDVRAHLRRGN